MEINNLPFGAIVQWDYGGAREKVFFVMDGDGYYALYDIFERYTFHTDVNYELTESMSITYIAGGLM